MSVQSLQRKIGLWLKKNSHPFVSWRAAKRCVWRLKLLVLRQGALKLGRLVLQLNSPLSSAALRFDRKKRKLQLLQVQQWPPQLCHFRRIRARRQQRLRIERTSTARGNCKYA